MSPPHHLRSDLRRDLCNDLRGDLRGDLPCPPRGLLFDMDGTLTEPMLDFAAIKSEMNIGDRAILEALAEMDDSRRAECDAILYRHEKHASENSTLNGGCLELLDFIAQYRLPTAVITRNSRMSLTTVLRKHGLKFDVVLSRDDGLPKPHPSSLISACERLGISPREVWMIGDGRYDVEAGNAAGIATVWLSGGREKPFEAEPTRTIQDLEQLRSMLLACLSL